MGFLIPDLDLQNLKVIAKGKGKQILLEELTAGNSESPLYLKTTGSIALNDRSINQSDLDLEIELKFSKQLLEQYSIFGMMLAQFKAGEGEYKLKLTGNMSRPITKPLK